MGWKSRKYKSCFVLYLAKAGMYFWYLLPKILLFNECKWVWMSCKNDGSIALDGWGERG